MKLIKFEKDGCSPCQLMQNYLDSKGIKVEKINPFVNPEIAVKYDVISIPTLILVDDNGNEIERTVGFRPDEIEKLISKLK